MLLGGGPGWANMDMGSGSGLPLMQASQLVSEVGSRMVLAPALGLRELILARAWPRQLSNPI